MPRPRQCEWTISSGAVLLVLPVLVLMLDRVKARAVPPERDLRARRRDPDVSLHLLVERRAEVGAVEGEDPDLLGRPGDSAGLARHHQELGVVRAGDREAV